MFYSTRSFSLEIMSDNNIRVSKFSPMLQTIVQDTSTFSGLTLSTYTHHAILNYYNVQIIAMWDSILQNVVTM